MQAQSDTFLGWTRTKGADNVERDFYVRQLEMVRADRADGPHGDDGLRPAVRMDLRPGARPSGDRSRWPPPPSRRLGQFDQAIADFAETYADQNERGCAALQAAVKDGKVEPTTEI